MSVPAIGESYRGVEGRSGYLLRQAWRALEGAMEIVLRPHGLSPVQYGVLTLLARAPGASGADLARAAHTSPQAMNGVLATLEREALIERRPHPTHGRILQATLTSEGQRRLRAANPTIRALERETERNLSPEEISTIKTWLVTTAQRLDRAPESRSD
ncbi:MAG: MarR family transcriptional regulator [Solirubrobacterales bacterium]|nr:MarR family transcriptional regulator [Solirubrobacterales bacterium]MBV9799710.1 MarR family transcriptional regulator [Solirubrobacterales bacterium]